MEGFGVSQQADEGYSEDPLTQLEPSTFKPADIGSMNPLSGASSVQLKGWLSAHIANLPTDLRARALVAEIVEKMNPRLYIDFIRYLPAEICLKVLGYLDPVSLLSVAQTCRAWYSLALDRTLWQTLYHYEGWKVVADEIEAAEEMVNRRTATGSMYRQKSEEDGHTRKKRAVSLEEDEDAAMTDAGYVLVDEPKTLEPDQSAFAGPSRSNMTPAFRGLNMQGSGSSSVGSAHKGRPITTDKGKGKAPASPSSALRPPQPPAHPSVNSGLWVWDPSLKRQRINWQYLYTMRRKLEMNWEQGNFKNFQLPHPDHPEEGHNGECIYSLQYNEEYLVSGSRDKTLRIWSLATRRLVRKPLIGHIGSVLCLQFDSDPNEDIIVSGSSDSDVIIWRFSTGEIIQRLTHAHRDPVLNVKFDKRILATCSKDRTIKIFNRRPMKPGDPGYVYPVPAIVKKYGYDDMSLDQQPTIPAFTMIGVLEGHSAAVNAVQVVDNEVVSASGDRQIKVWDWQTGVCKRTFVGHNKGIACVQYDGKRIVSGSSDNEVKVFDRETGIEVASLRDHTDLVRTVQAGFGDRPWSLEEDAAEAKRVDQAYMKALEDGELSASPRRGRHGNAGSSDPEEITAYGAKLPPGGGGGKRWGRIVSGSYDKTIIIWRRDKTGKWRPQHHLKQDEAAQRTQGTDARPPPGPPGPPGPPNGPGGGSGAGTGAGNSSRRGYSVPVPSRQAISTAINAARASRGTGPSSTVMIDHIMPQGVHALQQALAKYPAMLTLQSQLQAAIDREGSPFVRSQLRQVVSAATVRMQVAQARARVQGFQQGLVTADAAAASNGTSDDDTGAGGSGNPTGASSVGAPGTASAANPSVVGPPPPTGPGGGHRVHAHAPEVGMPTRIYKLQFDARRIICCSQTSVIVGWDFCNGDPALEEVARFFATVD
ncbi:hypothetical protein M406DRAFT_276450 [Cryphonectria parasitica EP155]|uniref:F-box domain-containing protein n=1 Tax=Cryphonectria parasitica (strain ATCC 38755 / EP155) TaxID=660469 RepID=A0A9P4Y415_CRYP1|nr:uncharacterized protein M406DRAFT_276450 [Cryphonectria parasitica EP155]KAF3765765.1 hypothetical protein M406DRAFT_276450 [Cryphonectria parasitica EP155]